MGCCANFSTFRDDIHPKGGGGGGECDRAPLPHPVAKHIRYSIHVYDVNNLTPLRNVIVFLNFFMA